MGTLGKYFGKGSGSGGSKKYSVNTGGSNKYYGGSDFNGATSVKSYSNNGSYNSYSNKSFSNGINNYSNKDNTLISQYQKAYNSAKANNNTSAMNLAHTNAEAIRQKNALMQNARQNFKAYNGGSAFTGDKAFSAPDYNYIKAFQSAYNIAKGNNDKDGMANAHRGAEEIRDKYRYYPTADTDGYGLGKNDIGFIRDMTVRYDDLGNKTIDEYGRSSVASRTYNPDGSLQYSHVSGSPTKHNAWVQNDIKDDKNGYFARLYDNSHQGLDRGSLEGLYSGDNGISSNSYYNGGDGNIYGGGENNKGGFANGTYSDIYEALKAAREAQLQAQLGGLEQSKTGINQSFDDIARQAYIAKRQGETAIPEQLSAMGITGGASESSLLGLNSNYENNINSNEVQRQASLDEITKAILNAKLMADSDINGYYADSMEKELSYNAQQEAERKAYEQWLMGFNYQKDQDNINNIWNDKKWEYQKEQDQLDRVWQEKAYNDDNRDREIDIAIKLGDYDKLASLGVITPNQAVYLKNIATEKLTSASRSVSGGGGGKGSDETENTSTKNPTIANANGNAWVYIRGLGRISSDELEKYLLNDKITRIEKNGKYQYVLNK